MTGFPPLSLKTRQLPLSIGDIKLSKDDVLLSDDCTLSECHIDNHSIIELNKGYPISLTIKLLSRGKEIGHYNINTFTDYTIADSLCEKATLEGFPKDPIINLITRFM